MFSTRSTALALIFVISCINLGLGQKLKVINVEELRSINNSWDFCKIEVKPIGDEIRNFTLYKISELKRAVDSKNINLLPEEIEITKYLPISESTIIQILKASRSANTLNIDGNIILYKPTEENGGLVKISGFKSNPKVNLAPKSASYTIHFYDKATLEEMAKKDANKRYEDIEKLPEKDKNFASELNSLSSSSFF